MFSVTSPPEHFLFCATSRFLARLKFYNRLTIVELIKHIAANIYFGFCCCCCFFVAPLNYKSHSINDRQTESSLPSLIHMYKLTCKCVWYNNIITYLLWVTYIYTSCMHVRSGSLAIWRTVCVFVCVPTVNTTIVIVCGADMTNKPFVHLPLPSTVVLAFWIWLRLPAGKKLMKCQYKKFLQKCRLSTIYMENFCKLKCWDKKVDVL